MTFIHFKVSLEVRPPEKPVMDNTRWIRTKFLLDLHNFIDQGVYLMVLVTGVDLLSHMNKCIPHFEKNSK